MLTDQDLRFNILERIIQPISTDETTVILARAAAYYDWITEAARSNVKSVSIKEHLGSLDPILNKAKEESTAQFCDCTELCAGTASPLVCKIETFESLKGSYQKVHCNQEDTKAEIEKAFGRIDPILNRAEKWGDSLTTDKTDLASPNKESSLMPCDCTIDGGCRQDLQKQGVICSAYAEVIED